MKPRDIKEDKEQLRMVNGIFLNKGMNYYKHVSNNTVISPMKKKLQNIHLQIIYK